MLGILTCIAEVNDVKAPHGGTKCDGAHIDAKGACAGQCWPMRLVTGNMLIQSMEHSSVVVGRLSCTQMYSSTG
jgi:hypothetical protein